MTHTIRFDGQVAIVTGAAGALGNSIARELGRRGAALLVNDYGGDVHGHGPARAEEATAAIRADGGRAVGDGTALGTGIARPLPIDETTDGQLELELRTNLLGPYALMRAAWPVMRKQGYGRILNVSSNAPLGIGNNTSYATAKAGLIGGGRVARVVFAESAGVAPVADAETAQARSAEVLDAANVRALESSFDELSLYSSEFPFEGTGGGRALDDRAVVSTKREHDRRS